MNTTETTSTTSQTYRDQSANVLIVDDDSQTIRVMLEILARKGIRSSVVSNKKDAILFLDKNNCDLAFIAVQIDMPQNSFELVSKIKTNQPELPVIMTAEAKTKNSQSELLQLSSQTAVRAINAGCYDFLIKPVSCGKIESILDTFLPNHPVETCESAELDSKRLYTIVGKSVKLAQTVNLAKKIAPTSAPVLISGESGTGKELISYLIYHYSKRAHGPYIRVNCAALSSSLLESELFGHEKGAFTGAHTLRKGRFETAHGGTLLLDEITETTPAFQAKLLRVLEQQDFERVGGNDSIRVNVRVISTSNKDLLQEVTEGRFRQDLYYRISGVRIIIPPLRERSDDLQELIWHFVNLYAHQAQRRITGLDTAMMDIFSKYHWPGNVRQLRNVVLTSLILGTGSTLSLADVSWLFDELQPLPQENKVSISSDQITDSASEPLPLEHIERLAIFDTLKHTSGNRSKAARILGISDRTLRDKIRRYRQNESMQLA